MKFVITESEKWTEGDVFTPSNRCVEFDWQLQSNDGDVICRNGDGFEDEGHARSDIARAKVSMKGARFAKVVAE